MGRVTLLKASREQKKRAGYFFSDKNVHGGRRKTPLPYPCPPSYHRLYLVHAQRPPRPPTPDPRPPTARISLPVALGFVMLKGREMGRHHSKAIPLLNKRVAREITLPPFHVDSSEKTIF